MCQRLVLLNGQELLAPQRIFSALLASRNVPIIIGQVGHVPFWRVGSGVWHVLKFRERSSKPSVWFGGCQSCDRFCFRAHSEPGNDCFCTLLACLAFAALGKSLVSSHQLVYNTLGVRILLYNLQHLHSLDQTAEVWNVADD